MSGPQSAVPSPLPTPTQDDRSMGMLVHILGIFTGFLGPLIMYIIKRDSKFVSFHALQSVFWHLLYWIAIIAFMMIFVVLFFVFIVSQVAMQQRGPGSAPPLGVFFMFPIFWLVVMAAGLLNLILAVLFALKANAGEWTAYPIVGGWARRAVGI